MFELFTSDYQPRGNVISPPTFDLIKRNATIELRRLKQYYLDRVFSIPNQHILNRVLMTGMAPLNYPIERFLDVVNARADYIAKAFQFTNEISSGHEQRKSFYSSATTEYILAVNSYISPFSTHEEVYNSPCIRVVVHPCNIVSMKPPDSSDYADLNGLVVIELDIAKMLVQYRRFALSRMARNKEGEDLNVSTFRFITTTLLPQLIESHVQWCWLNRVMARHYGDPDNINVLKPAIATLSYTPQLNKIADGIIHRLKNSKMMYYDMLRNIPGMFGGDMLSFLRLADITTTRQVWWLMVLCRLRVVRFLIDLGGTNAIRTNRTYINNMQVNLKRLLNGSIPEGVMPADIEMDMRIEAQYLTHL